MQGEVPNPLSRERPGRKRDSLPDRRSRKEIAGPEAPRERVDRVPGHGPRLVQEPSPERPTSDRCRATGALMRRHGSGPASAWRSKTVPAFCSPAPARSTSDARWPRRCRAQRPGSSMLQSRKPEARDRSDVHRPCRRNRHDQSTSHPGSSVLQVGRAARREQGGAAHRQQVLLVERLLEQGVLAAGDRARRGGRAAAGEPGRRSRGGRGRTAARRDASPACGRGGRRRWGDAELVSAAASKRKYCVCNDITNCCLYRAASTMTQYDYCI